jgi:capsid assembly protease
MRSIHLSRAAMEPWLILPEQLAVISEIVTRYFSGEKLSTDEVELRTNGGKCPAERIAGDIAVVPLFGTIFPRANMFTELSGATSAEMFGKRFDALVKDPEIGAIVLDVDSPGGQAPGIEELAQKIYQARGRKPIVAVANHLMASAAYWIGTAADEVVATPSASVGSIGAYTIHEDLSAAMEKEGVKVSVFKAGKYKAEMNPFEPLTDEARGKVQEMLDELYGRFVSAVARQRGESEARVRSDFGEGRMVSSRKAAELGMVDRVATLEEVIDGLRRGEWARPARGARAETIEPAGMVEENVSGAVISKPEPVAEEDEEDGEAEALRKYLEVFGPKKGGETNG